MKALKMYAKYYTKMIAMEEILKDLHPIAIRELKKYPEGKADFDGVEFHLTKKTEKKYNEKAELALKMLRENINEIKKEAEAKGMVEITEKETFDASIPRSNKKNVLAKISEYKKHFVMGE